MSTDDRDAGAQNPQQVEDPGEFNQRLRLREIADARRNAREALASPNMLRQEVKGSGISIQEIVLNHVKTFAAEIEWLVREEGDEEYFTKPLGTVTIPTPTTQEFKEAAGSEIKKIIKGVDGPKSIVVNGLYATEETGPGYIDFTTPLSYTYTAHAEVRHKGPQDVSVTKHRHIPLEVSMEANRLCRKFINEAGLDARLEEEDPHGQL